MLNHLVEQEIAAGLWLRESFSAGNEAIEFDAETFVLADELDKDEWIDFATALLQCHLLLQLLQFLWK